MDTNPFGSTGAFGQQSPVFGQKTESSSFSGSNAGQSSSVFGQQTSTVSTPSLFGQNTSNPPPVFGQTNALTSGAFSRPSGGLSQSGFGQSSQPTSGFGNQPLNFSGGFGQTTQSQAGFGQTSQSFVQSTGTFGQATTSSGSFGQTSNVFSQSSTSATPSFGGFGKPAGQTTTSTSSAGLFVKPGDSQGATSSGLFGRKDSSNETKSFSSSGSGEQSGGFGHRKPIKQEAPVFGSSSLFGKKQEETENTTEKKSGSDSKQTFGFFPVKQAKKEQAEESSNLIGKGSMFNKTTSRTGSASRGLFGKPVKDKEGHAEMNSEMNTEIKYESSEQGTAQRDQGNDGKTLFGKPVAGSSKPRGLRRLTNEEDEETGPRKKPLIRRLSSTPEDISKRIVIVCKNVDTKYNNGSTLRKHFSRFGTVVKVYPNTNKRQATIHFKTHDDAAEAKRRGASFGSGLPRMSIFWSSYSANSSPRSTVSRSSTSTEDENFPRKRNSDVSLKSTTSKRRAWAADEVNEELQSMSGTEDLKTKAGVTTVTAVPRLSRSQRSPEKPTQTRSPSPTPTSSSTDRTEKVSMHSFTKSVCRTATDRVNILELRDKYIRQNRRKKATDLATAKAFQGTCPDMCPEKERYDREDKRRLHPYEVLPGSENIPGKNPTVDHRRAVKEYMRSSPDQDEPLAHELRPVKVLVKTMMYLLQEIADRGEDGRWGDWFDFLWNRTRGIRKDITQQQLCDRDTVSLLENCVRFHIYCAERLCEEDMHSFDSKINNENLTKCLQTLKEFYYDLETKQKCFCASEAEFRAYTVLMNLNEGDTLRQVQQLRWEIRNDRQIRFAIQVFFALNNNNYIRFFRLVKDAPFAVACIMHRYFTQVRNRALVSMMKGYGMGNRAAQIPLSYFVEMLGFEDETEASDFGEHYGFNVKDGDMVLDKSEYLEPETAWSMRRSENLIETKLTVSVGEMINGDVLPPPDLTPPSASFDDNGCYVNAVELPSRATAEPVQPTTSFKPVIEQSQQQTVVRQEPIKTLATERAEVTQKMLSGAYIKDTAKQLFWEVIDEMCRSLAEEKMLDIQFVNSYTQEYITSLISQTVYEDQQSLCKDVIEEEKTKVKLAEREEKRKQDEERKDRVAAMLTDEYIEDMVQQESRNLATIEVREIHAQLRRDCIDRCTLSISQDLVFQTVAEISLEVADEVFETDVTQRLQKLDELQACVELARAGRFLRRWKKEYIAVSKLKRAMLVFPSAPNMNSFEKQTQAFIPSCRSTGIEAGRFYINNTARLSTESPIEVMSRWNRLDTQMAVHEIYDRLKREAAWKPLDLSAIIGTILLNKVKQRNKGSSSKSLLLWKLLLCLPEETNIEDTPSVQDLACNTLCDWLKVKFSKGAMPRDSRKLKGEMISLYKTTIPRSRGRGRGRGDVADGKRLGICVRTVEGTLTRHQVEEMENSRALFGSAGVILLLPPVPTNPSGLERYWADSKKRLSRLLDVEPKYLALPLVILLPVLPNENICKKRVHELLEVEELIDGGQLGAVTVEVIPMNDLHPRGVDVIEPGISERLCKSLQWMGGETNLPPQLNVKFIKDFIEDILLQEYYTPVLQNLKKRKTMGHLHQDCHTLLDLYNSVVQHMEDVLTAPRLSTVSWPVPEFVTSTSSTNVPPAHWNSPEHLECLRQLIISLQLLPEVTNVNPETATWADINNDLFEYLSEVVGNDTGAAKVTLVSRIRVLLLNVEKEFRDSCYLLLGEEDERCEPSYFNVPWSKVVDACIDYRLATTNFADPNIMINENEDEEGEDENEIRVAYFADSLRAFRPPSYWRHLESEKSIAETRSLNRTVVEAVSRVWETDQSIYRPDISIIPEPVHAKAALEVSTRAKTVLQSIQQERRRSDHFEKYLQQVVKDGEIGTDSILDINNSNIFDTIPVFHSPVFGSKSFMEEKSQNCYGQLSPNNHPEEEELQDPVMSFLREPLISEKLENLQAQLSSNRRESEIFEERLRALVTDF